MHILEKEIKSVHFYINYKQEADTKLGLILSLLWLLVLFVEQCHDETVF